MKTYSILIACVACAISLPCAAAIALAVSLTSPLFLIVLVVGYVILSVSLIGVTFGTSVPWLQLNIEAANHDLCNASLKCVGSLALVRSHIAMECCKQ